MENQIKEYKKPDRRIAKTKRAICNAFVELLSIKDINKITITDVADVADVNRKTVYNYYSDIYQILDEIENELVRSYEQVIAKIDITNNAEGTYKIFDALTDVLNSNLDFYGKILRIQTNTKLVDKIINALKIRLKMAFLQKELYDKEKADLLAAFIVSGMIAAYQTWFNSGREQSLEEFSKDVSNLVAFGISSFKK